MLQVFLVPRLVNLAGILLTPWDTASWVPLCHPSALGPLLFLRCPLLLLVFLLLLPCDTILGVSGG